MATYYVSGESYKTLPEFIEALHASGLVNAYKPWSKEEDAELTKLRGKLTVHELAIHFKRRKGAINSRLKKLDEGNLLEGKVELNPRKNYEEYLRLLAEGIHPLTGEILQDASTWRHPEIINDLLNFLK